MRRRDFLRTSLAAASVAGLPRPAEAQSESPEALARQAFTFAYPLVCMDLTQRIMCTPSSDRPSGALNSFLHGREVFDHRFYYIRCVNNDTLYSGAWINVKREPVVLSVPESNGRFYVGSLVHAWNDSLRSIGTRTNQGRAQRYFLTGPGWKGTAPEGLEHVPSPTNLMWMPLRIYVRGSDDLPGAHELQDGFRIQPWSQHLSSTDGAAPTGAPAQDPAPTDAPAPPNTNVPADAQIFRMDTGSYYKRFCDLMVDNPPLPGDAPFLSRIAKLGLKPGGGGELKQVSTKIQAALTASLRGAGERLLANKGREKKIATNNRWETLLNGSDFGSDYDRRAYVTMTIGVGMMRPEDTLYPRTNVDSTGKPLVGANRYELTFAADQLPPAEQFWSVTAYQYPELLLVQNALNRYSLGDRSDLARNPDGSITITIQNREPSADRKQNWLPVPSGRFELVIRLYRPKEEALAGKWSPPPLLKKG